MDKNSVVDISYVKLVDKYSVLVENTGLKLKELDKEAVVYQSVFTRVNREIASLPNSAFNTFLLQAPAD